MDLLSEDPELGVALDWLRLEGVPIRVPAAVLETRRLPLGVTLVLLLAGFALTPALLGGTLVLLAE